MKIALAQINTAMGDLVGNERKIRNYLDHAIASQCDLAIFPELALIGYPPRDQIFQTGFFEQTQSIVQTLAKDYANIDFILGSAEKNHNVAYFISKGSIQTICKKNLLPNYDIFDERRYFKPGSEPEIVTIQGKTAGITICEDIWAKEIPIYNNDPIKLFRGKKLDFVINISASPFELNKAEKRREVVARNTQLLNTPIIYVNLVGGNDEIIFDGGSFVMDEKGNVVEQLSFFKEELKCFEFSKSSVQNNQNEEKNETEIENMAKALVLGLRDFVAKCGFKDVALGLSGGVDSALVLLLAVEAFGKDNVHPVFMPSKYTSQDSKDDVSSMIQKLEIPIEIIPITEIFESFGNTLQASLQEELKSLTLENIQSRIRGNLLMAFSSQRNAMILNTGNKSEIATGYCTLYGDTIGGVAVLGDLYKNQVYALTRYLNQKHQIIPERVLTRAPSAELKDNQKDSDSLPPYDILDEVVKNYIELHESVEQIVAKGFNQQTVESIIKMIRKSEFKRKQMPPILRISEKAFGSGRRMPIARTTYGI